MEKVAEEEEEEDAPDEFGPGPAGAVVLEGNYICFNENLSMQ